MTIVAAKGEIFTAHRIPDKKNQDWQWVAPYGRLHVNRLQRMASGASQNQPQVRFLWRFDLERFLRLCCEILRRRFFLRLPMINLNEAGKFRILPVQVKPFSEKTAFSLTVPAKLLEKRHPLPGFLPLNHTDPGHFD